MMNTIKTSSHSHRRGFARALTCVSESSHGKRGFTLLYAVLVSSLLLAVGIAIFNIATKQILLSSAARASQTAFYGADTGIECAFYWDFQPSSKFAAGAPPDTINCAGVSLPTNPVTSGATTTTQFKIDNGNYCITVKVEKTETPRRTQIEARGQNTCDGSSLRRVERAIRAIY